MVDNEYHEKIHCYDKGHDLATAMLANCCNKDNGMNTALTAMMAGLIKELKG